MEKKFDNDLEKYLQKCELEYRAKKKPEGSTVKWLAPYCDSIEDLVRFLRNIGFHIADIVNETDIDGTKYQWAETTNGVLAYVNRSGVEGLVAKAAGREKRNK